MININELRRLAQMATPGPWHFWRGWVAADIDNDGGVVIVERPTPSGGKYQARVDANFKFIAATNPQAILELLDRLEAAEKERDDLRAKIEQMERQEPIGEIVAFGEFLHEPSWKRGKLPHLGAKLYALPGAHPSYLPSDLAEAIIADMQAQYDSEMITENDSCEALIRLDGAIAAVEDNFAAATEAKP